jgi:hypothetical protein
MRQVAAWMAEPCPYPAQGGMLALLWLFFLQEFADYFFYVAVLAVYGVV